MNINYSFGRTTPEEAEDGVFTLRANGKAILWISEFTGGIELDTNLTTYGNQLTRPLKVIENKI